MKKPFSSSTEKDKDVTSLTDSDYNKKKLFKKGINYMADEKLEEASAIFEQALRIDPNNVEVLLKLGYARFHLNDYEGSLRAYDQILDIDVTNAEAWNLKSLIHYEQKKYLKALDCAEKSIESDPTFDMAWYNKACYLSLLTHIPESLDALKRSIEIDVKNARKAVKDRDFKNVRVEDGFKRIIEVVVLESVRQGYHTIGAIVWTTFLDKIDVETSLQKLIEKGIIVVHEKRQGLSRIPTYDLIPSISTKIGAKKNTMKLIHDKPILSDDILEDLSAMIQQTKETVRYGNVDDVIEKFGDFVNPKKHGSQMIEHFFEEHREIRLWIIRLTDHGKDYLDDNSEKILDTLDNIDAILTKKLRSKTTFYSADKSQ
ncbi:MAG: tetratricopeptide repeat protein [Candidatus Nitrosoabyssus spongiisocia]|nr:MAG: tetratricopeptide repeat protein [Nitrosopumilaceae archaeon AB1(1)]